MAAMETLDAEATLHCAGRDAAGHRAASAGDAEAGNPFDLEDERAYQRWRAWKLDHRARDASALLVDVRDLRSLAPAERARLLQVIGRQGAAVYRSPHTEAASDLPRALGAQLGLLRLHANWLADEDGISPITVHGRDAGEAADAVAEAAAGEGTERLVPRGDFIPYTNRAIGWHTDGYYQSDDCRILGMILHCVRPAAEGGETALADPELVYIALRDEDPALVRALMHPQAMNIPARQDDAGVARAEQGGAVFALVAGTPRAGAADAAQAADAAEAAPRLHMRYTARTRSIGWRDDALTRRAAARITTLLDSGDFVIRLKLAAGMGLVGRNVLHKRTAFVDEAAAPRLLYRARFLDRVVAAEEDAWRDRASARLGEG